LLAGEAVSQLRIGPSHRPLVVSGLLTGVHSPEESHYDLLGAFVDRVTLDASSAHASALGFHNHELGDASLILPGALSNARRAMPRRVGEPSSGSARGTSPNHVLG
jgi:S-adenosylmethionine:tRNA-ribosyltransferase-isomerase (queuine synthetase)